MFATRLRGLPICLLAAMRLAYADPAPHTVPPPAPALPVTAPAAPATPAPVAARPDSIADDPGTRLLAALAAAGPQHNVILSPLSLEHVGTLLLAGSQGATQAELLKTFGHGATSVDAALDTARARRQQLLADPSAELRLADGIWLAKDVKPRPDYTQSVENALGAKTESLDFAQADSVGKINSWFAQGTAGLIPQLLDELPADTQAVLGNALYFKGHWLKPFDAAETRPAPFHAPGASVQRPFMHQHYDGLAYRETPKAQAVKLPFAANGYELIVVLPAAGTDPQALLGAHGEGLAEWVSTEGYAPTHIQLALPKLDLDATAELRAPLGKLGLETALGPQADYQGLSDHPLAISRIVQKTVLKVDETGAEAAAATAAITTRSAIMLVENKVVTVDRPYLLVLRHVASGAAVIVAAIQDPGR